jgi:hypothetical protein
VSSAEEKNDLSDLENHLNEGVRRFISHMRGARHGASSGRRTSGFWLGAMRSHEQAGA